MENMKNVELLKFDSDVHIIKYKVLEAVARKTFNRELIDEDKLARKIVPGPDPITRCCIYHEREIIRNRVRVASGGNKDDNGILEVIEAACDECSIERYKVTEACRGCLSHRCKKSCPFDAIKIINKKAVIDYDLCKECGKCKNACPYNAIADIRRPCISACEVKAISIDEEKKAVIDKDKCINCGKCSKSCPFGAIMDKSQTIEIIKDMINNDRRYNIYAIIAPAIASQFTFATIGQVVNAIKKVGFSDVVEVALGADIIAEHEAREFSEVLKEKEFMTTSCCPAFVQHIKKSYPELLGNMSNSVSPMIATARLIKKTDPKSKVVFIGPCMAKKGEALEYEAREAVDYVLTFEELLALLDAADISVKECKEAQLNNGSYFGRVFAKSGGVTEAIAKAMEEFEIEGELKPIRCDGIKECDRNLKLAKLKRLQGNFIEGMACEGGCINGSGAVDFNRKSKDIVCEYGSKAIENSIKESLRVFDLEGINLER